MPGITLGPVDAAELAEVLTFLTRWLSGRQKHALAESFAAFAGHPAYNTDTLRADLHRFVFLLGASDGEGLSGEPTPRSTRPGLRAQLLTRSPCRVCAGFSVVDLLRLSGTERPDLSVAADTRRAAAKRIGRRLGALVPVEVEPRSVTSW